MLVEMEPADTFTDLWKPRFSSLVHSWGKFVWEVQTSGPCRQVGPAGSVCTVGQVPASSPRKKSWAQRSWRASLQSSADQGAGCQRPSHQVWAVLGAVPRWAGSTGGKMSAVKSCWAMGLAQSLFASGQHLGQSHTGAALWTPVERKGSGGSFRGSGKGSSACLSVWQRWGSFTQPPQQAELCMCPDVADCQEPVVSLRTGAVTQNDRENHLSSFPLQL